MDSRSRIEKGLLGFFGMFLIFFFVAVFGGCLSSCKGSFLAELAMIGTTGCMTAWSLWIKDSVGSSPTRLVGGPGPPSPWAQLSSLQAEPQGLQPPCSSSKQQEAFAPTSEQYTGLVFQKHFLKLTSVQGKLFFCC